MRILITGGFGYVGGRLAQFFASKSENEVLLGTRRGLSKSTWLSQVGVVQTRWNSPSELEKICTGIDVVIHAAGMSASECSVDPVSALESNGVFTSRLLQAALQQGVKTFVYLSTAHVYASTLEGVITEETCPTNLHPYATSHRAGEDVLRSAHERGAINGIVVRLSNAFGAPAHRDVNCWSLLVNDLCRQVVMTRKMILHSSGTQRRDFIPMNEVCRALECLIHMPAQISSDGLFNVGGGWSPSIWEMATLIQKRCEVVFRFQPEILRIPPEPGENSPELDYRLDALHRIGFCPSGDVNGEIDRLLEFCKASFEL